MRKDSVIFVSLIILGCLTISCKKVVHLELNTSSSSIVIQGNIYDHAGPFVVKISRSVNFYDPSTYPAVTGAKVIISDNLGHIDQLTERLPGIYVTSILLGIPHTTYNLKANIDGQTYSASSTMPEAVDISAITFQKSLFGKDIYPGINFADPPNISNYYRIIYAVNDVPYPDINVTDDKLSEGKTIAYVIRPADTDVKLKSGDNVTMLLESVDEGVYEYFRTAGREGGQSASPANPTSNISNGALGYFNACSVRVHSAIVP